MSTGRFVWNDLMTTDTNAAQGFYTELLGWKFTPHPDGSTPYWIINDGSKDIGGMMTISKDMGPMPSHWLPYVNVADCEESAAKAKSLGGSVHVPPTVIPKTGTFSMIADPQGVSISIIALDDPPTGPIPTPLPGEFCWFSLSTTSIPAASTFYEAMFPWTIKPVDVGGGDLRNVVFLGEAMIADVADIDGALPPNWGSTVAVADIDGIRAKFIALGGSNVSEIFPVGGMGRTFVGTDPTGAAIFMYQGNEPA